jgi:hypothetical protein
MSLAREGVLKMWGCMWRVMGNPRREPLRFDCLGGQMDERLKEALGRGDVRDRGRSSVCSVKLVENRKAGECCQNKYLAIGKR